MGGQKQFSRPWEKFYDFFVPWEKFYDFLYQGNFFIALKLSFSLRKLVPNIKKYILLLIKTRFSICNAKRIVLHFVQTVLAFGPFFGIFWPSRGLAASLRPKNPSKRASGQNSLDTVLKIFCHCSCKICSLLRIKIYQCNFKINSTNL